jgi:hypothetical protein
MKDRVIAPLAAFALLASPTLAETGNGTPECRIADVAAELSADPSDVLESGFTRQDIRTLTTRMCQGLVHHRSIGSDRIGEEIETHILNLNGWDRDTPHYQSRVAGFWNDHAEHFICRNHGHRFMDQHFLMRTVEMQYYQYVLTAYMLQDESLYPFDMNIVQIDQHGRAETLLDHLDAIIADPGQHPDYNMPEIRGLREMLVTFYDARSASEVCP